MIKLIRLIKMIKLIRLIKLKQDIKIPCIEKSYTGNKVLTSGLT